MVTNNLVALDQLNLDVLDVDVKRRLLASVNGLVEVLPNLPKDLRVDVLNVVVSLTKV